MSTSLTGATGSCFEISVRNGEPVHAVMVHMIKNPKMFIILSYIIFLQIKNLYYITLYHIIESCKNFSKGAGYLSLKERYTLFGLGNVYGTFVSTAVVRLFEILKMFYPPKGEEMQSISSRVPIVFTYLYINWVRKRIWHFRFSGGNPPL